MSPVIVIARVAPHGSSRARAALDVTFALAAFDRPVELLFLGAGVLQLLPGQDGRALGRQDLHRQLCSLPLYDVERVWAEREALDAFGIDHHSLPAFVSVVDRGALRRRIDAGAQVLTL